ncbi:MAG: glycosyltransferase [Terriglobia bacterium]
MMSSPKAFPLRRILFVTTTTQVGGAEKILLAIAAHLHGKGVAVAVCSLKETGAYGKQLESLGIPVTSLGMPDQAGWRGILATLFALPGLIKQIRAFRPQIVHAFLFRANFLARIAASFCGVPVNISSIRIIEQDHPFYYMLDRITSSLVTQYLAVSEQVKVATCNRSRIAPERILVIRNGIDLPANGFDGRLSEEASKAATMNYGRDSILCGTVARLHPQKGIVYLLEAIKLLQPEFPRLELLIVGEGPERSALLDRAAALGISGQVLFAGHCHPPFPYLRKMKIFVLPSLYEGFPNALLEAMAVSVPIVATDVGGVSELVESGTHGLLVPPGSASVLAEAIRSLLLDPERAKQLAAAAFDRIQKEFSLQGMLKDYDDLYEKLLMTDTCCG